MRSRFCDAVRALRPDIVFGADLIVGFPTETEAMFAAFPRSRRGLRPDAPARLSLFAAARDTRRRMPAVAAGEVRERAARLRAAGAAALQAISQPQAAALTGLAERDGLGRAEDFTQIAFTGQSGHRRDRGAEGHPGHDGKRAIAPAQRVLEAAE